MSKTDERSRKPLVLQGPGADSIVVHAFPDDGRFLRDLRRIALAVTPSATNPRELRDLLQDALRPWYPRLVIRARDGLASLRFEGDDDHDDEVWYAMRDGRVSTSRERTDHLHLVLADARETWRQSETAMERALAAASVPGGPRRGRGARTALKSGPPASPPPGTARPTR